MKTFANIQELQQALKSHQQQGQSIAFVPTMGNLHEGHLDLVRMAKKHADIIVTSIFVNPMQFGANEDLDSYPKTLAADQEKLAAEGNHYLFTPSNDMIYPNGLEHHSRVIVPYLGEHHCGSSRPGHFDGVTTVVSILFNIVRPDIAVFGEKDFQQLAIIKQMVKDLFLPIKVLGCPTGRAESGLALSSRNQYLTDEHRQLAPLLQQMLQRCKAECLNAPRSEQTSIRNRAIAELTAAGIAVIYFNIVDAIDLHEPTAKTQEFVILAGIQLGKSRLIDNVSFSLNP